MRLRSQLLALSLLTLLLPWSGWKLVQELENFLRQGEETSMLTAARTIAQALPREYQSDLKLARGQILLLRQLAGEPILDGYMSDWSEPDQSLEFAANDGLLKLNVLAGRYGRRFYLLLKVTDDGEINATSFNTGTSDPGQRAGLMLYVQTSRSQHAYMISTEAPGPLTLNSQLDTGIRLEAAWMDTADGYQVEVSLPGDVRRISVGAMAPSLGRGGASTERFAGTLNGRQQDKWLELASRDDAVALWLAHVAPQKARVWLAQADGWVMADSGSLPTEIKSELTWVQRMIYQAVADSRMPVRQPWPEWPVRFDSEAINIALDGGDGARWSRDPDSAAVYNLVAVPVVLDGGVVGAVVMEATSEGLLLMTNRALGQLLFVAMLLVAVLAGGLWLFASRLSRRVQKLSSAVSSAMDDTGLDETNQPAKLPVTTSRDELGDLARNTEKLLKAVAGYTGYLKKLAGRLSHELKTPIAITRSSLENLASQDLDPQAQRYLERAREGLDRQAAIVRAMSEAQRLEGAVKTADWESIKLGDMLKHCVEGYRSVHPSRAINLIRDTDDGELRCAPELIAQALDKLVDNAVSLSPQESVIDISLQHDGENCRISVINSGTRLPDVLHDQLFDSLVSLRENSRSGQHLGLGLYIVRLVAEAHGGKVSAHNLPDNAGVEFVMVLPAT